jgi:hypothetical protein
MALQSKIASDSDELALGLCFFDSILMAYTFWAPDLTLPGEWLPKLSLEQKLMYSDQSQRTLFCTGRKIAKSLVGECQILRKAFCDEIPPGQTVEGMITTPRESQMEILHGRVIQKLRYDPLLSTLIRSSSSGDKPILQLRNGFVWHFRIEGMSNSDTNMIGLRCKHIFGDEQQLGNWSCFDSRKMSALPDCTFLYAGVPNGVRGTPFYSLDKTSAGEGWSRHKYPTFINPLYQTEERQRQLVDDYSGENSFAYQTQVLGEWGDETISSFPPGTISVIRGEAGRVFIKEYRSEHITPYADSLGSIIQIPSIRCYSWCMGGDYGATSDPTVLIFATRTSSDAAWIEKIRITLNGVSQVYQADIVKYVSNFVLLGKCMGMCSDDQGLIDNLRDKMRDKTDIIFNATPAGTTVLTDNDGKIKLDAKGKPVKMRNKQYMTELLRKYMINANMNLEGVKLWLGDDSDLIDELSGTTERKTEGGYTVYYSPKTQGNWQPRAQDDHRRDACTYLAYAIHLGVLQDSERYSEAQLLETLGWCGRSDGVWTPPWQCSSEMP